MSFDPSRHSYVPELNARKAERAAADAKLKRVLTGARRETHAKLTNHFHETASRMHPHDAADMALDAVARAWEADHG